MCNTQIGSKLPQFQILISFSQTSKMSISLNFEVVTEFRRFVFTGHWLILCNHEIHFGMFLIWFPSFAQVRIIFFCHSKSNFMSRNYWATSIERISLLDSNSSSIDSISLQANVISFHICGWYIPFSIKTKWVLFYWKTERLILLSSEQEATEFSIGTCELEMFEFLYLR